MATAQPDVEIQREYDVRRGVSMRLLAARFMACVAARKAVETNEEYGVVFSFRQSLVDLAACASEMAAALPAPTVHMEPQRKRSRRH